MSELPFSRSSTHETKAGIMAGPGDRRIVLLGKTGAGKSSAGNSILEDTLFTTSCLPNSDTSKCEIGKKIVNGREITLIDTPGFFSTKKSNEQLESEIIKCIVECSPGPHAFLIVLPVGRYTPEEKNVVEEILKMFGEKALKYAVVLFTHGDQLEGNMTIQEFVNENDHLKKLVKKCGDRLHVIDNKYWNNPTVGHDDRNNSVQINKLLDTIDEMVTNSKDGDHYINVDLQAVEQAIQQEMKNGETRENAKLKIQRFLIQSAGASTGALLGALLGVVACGGIVLALLSALIKTAASSAGSAVVAGAELAAVSSTGLALGITAGVFGGAVVCAGAVRGGIVGAEATKEAKTMKEAASRAAYAVKDDAEALKNIIDIKRGKMIYKNIQANEKL